jgi:hypothetical protein
MSVQVPQFLTSNSTMSVPAPHFLRPFTLYGPLPFTTLCPFYDPLSPLPPSVSSTALYLLRPSVLSMAFCPLCGLCPLYCPLSYLRFLSYLRPSVPSTAMCLLYGPLYPLWASAPSTGLCPLHGPLSPLLLSVLSTAL